MAPKGKPEKPTGPAKVKPDLTFGLKNKGRSAKVQDRVKDIERQQASMGKNKETATKEKEKELLKARKAMEQKKKDEINSLFTPIDIVQPKIPFGVDAKSVLCAFFKAGRCQKGAKCKYSHDLDQDRKQVKASIYADVRDEAKLADTMDKWDDERLKEVIGQKGNSATTTDIVCKHFIDAVESGLYGWFWECPDGGLTCKYRHALPPGFVLKSQKKKEEEDAKKVEITLEEFLDVERHKLDQSKLTPLTLESFAKWKKTRMSKKEAEATALTTTSKALHASGRNTGLSGRTLFEFNKELLDSDDEDSDDGNDFDIDAFRKQQTDMRAEMEDERIRKLGAAFDDYELDES